MARPPPDDDPRITDLERYRKAREQAAKRPPPKPKAPKQSFLGSNPRAGLILVAVITVLALLYLGPRFF